MKTGWDSRCQAPRIGGLGKFFREGRHTETIDKKGSVLPEECICKQRHGNGNVSATFLYEVSPSLARVVCLWKVVVIERFGWRGRLGADWNTITRQDERFNFILQGSGFLFFYREGECVSVWGKAAWACWKDWKDEKLEAEKICAFHGWMDSVGHGSVFQEKMPIQPVRQTCALFSSGSLALDACLPFSLCQLMFQSLPSEFGSRFISTRRPIWCLVYNWFLIWVNDPLKKNGSLLWTLWATAERHAKVL